MAFGLNASFPTLLENLTVLTSGNQLKNALVYHWSFIYKLIYPHIKHYFTWSWRSYSVSASFCTEWSPQGPLLLPRLSLCKSFSDPTLLPPMPFPPHTGPCQFRHFSEVHLIVHILYTALPIYSSFSGLLHSPYHLHVCTTSALTATHRCFLRHAKYAMEWRNSSFLCSIRNR